MIVDLILAFSIVSFGLLLISTIISPELIFEIFSFQYPPIRVCTVLIVLSILGLIYLFFERQKLIENKVAFNSASKMSVEEYEEMKKHMTKTEVEKLIHSKEYNDFLIKKLQK